MRLYHGSDIGGITELKPMGYGKLFLVENLAVTVMYMVNPLKVYAHEKNIKFDGNRCALYHVDNDGVVYPEEYFPNMMEWVFKGKKAFLYYVDIDESEVKSSGKNNGELYSDKPIKVSGCIEIEDVYEYILKLEKEGKINIWRYEELTDKAKETKRNRTMEIMYKEPNNLFTLFCKDKFSESLNITEAIYNEYIKQQKIENNI